MLVLELEKLEIELVKTWHCAGMIYFSFTKSELKTPPTLDNTGSLKNLIKVKILSYPFAFWYVNKAQPLPILQTQKQGERVKILYPAFTDFYHLWAVRPCQLKDCKDFQLAPVKNIYLYQPLPNSKHKNSPLLTSHEIKPFFIDRA